MGVVPRVRFGLLLGLFLALSMFAAAMSWSFTMRTGASIWTLQPDASATLWYVVAMNLLYWGTWALLAPPALWAARRWRLDAAGWRRAVALHMAFGFAVGCIHVVIVATGRTLLQRAIGMQVSWEDRVWEMFFRTIDWEMTLYFALVGVQHALLYHAEAQQRALRAAHLETRLVEAQLQALQRQLHPHFLFNTLHAISALVHRDPDKADEMIERLSDLLRLTLDRVGVQEVPLCEELEYLRAYLVIEQVHFGDRLRIEYQIDAAALDALVPSLILQPLAENAIRHGLEPRAGRGLLTIQALVDGARLRLCLADNGAGLPRPVGRASQHGVGLSNTRARLERLHGDAASLEIGPNHGGGVKVTVGLPFRAADEGAVRRPEVA